VNLTKDKPGNPKTIAATFQVEEEVWEQMLAVKAKTKVAIRYLMHDALTDFLAKQFTNDLARKQPGSGPASTGPRPRGRGMALWNGQ
jgi:hypothetical protein